MNFICSKTLYIRCQCHPLTAQMYQRIVFSCSLVFSQYASSRSTQRFAATSALESIDANTYGWIGLLQPSSSRARDSVSRANTYRELHDQDRRRRLIALNRIRQSSRA